MGSRSIVITNQISDEWMSEHQFTDSARRFLSDAFFRGMDRGLLGQLPPVLLLWSMLRWERKTGVLVLERCGVDLTVLERNVNSELGSVFDTDYSQGVDLTHILSVAKQAVNEAAVLGHEYVGSEHLVLALCRETDEALKRIFHTHNVSAERYAAVLKDMLNA